MGAKRFLIAQLVFFGSIFVFQLLAPVIGSGQENPNTLGNEDKRLALNNQEMKKLMQLETQLKANEMKLAKINSEIAKLSKSKWPKVKKRLSSSRTKKSELEATIRNIKSEIQSLGGLNQLYESESYKNAQLKKLQKQLSAYNKKLEQLDNKIAMAQKSKWPKIKKWLSSGQKQKAALTTKIKEIKNEIRKYGGSC